MFRSRSGSRSELSKWTESPTEPSHSLPCHTRWCISYIISAVGAGGIKHLDLACLGVAHLWGVGDCSCMWRQLSEARVETRPRSAAITDSIVCFSPKTPKVVHWFGWDSPSEMPLFNKILGPSAAESLDGLMKSCTCRCDCCPSWGTPSPEGSAWRGVSPERGLAQSGF